MSNVLQLSSQPRVFNTAFVLRLSEANRAVRQLRRLGCRIVRQTIGDRDNATEIVVDRNPHRVLNGCPGVHVTVGRSSKL